MRRLAWAAAAWAGLAMAVGGPALAEDFLHPINLPKDSVINFTVTRSGTKTAGGQTTGEGMTATFHYRLDVQPNRDGYRVKITALGADLPAGLPAEDRAALQQSVQTLSGLEFQADADLYPLEIIDWRNQIDRLIGAVAQQMNLPVTDPSLVATRSVYAALSPEEAAARLLEEWIIPTLPQDMALDVGKPVQLGAPAAGQGLSPRQTMELKSIDRTAGRAIVEYSNILDPEAAKAFLAEGLQRLMQAIPPASRPTAEALASLKFEQTTTCRYEMDLATGLTAKADCTRRAQAVDDGLKQQSRTDHYVITQGLAAP